MTKQKQLWSEAIRALYHTVWHLMESSRKNFLLKKTFFLPLLEVLKKLIFCVMQKSALRNNCPFQHKYKPGTISASSMTLAYYEPQHAQGPPKYVSQGSHLYISGGHQFHENDVKQEQGQFGITRLHYLARARRCHPSAAL